MQPGPYDHTPANQARRIAHLTDYEPLMFGSAVNHIDAAIAALDDIASVTPDIMTIGRPVNPPVPAFLNQSVAKHGRTTGLTFGMVVDISFDGNVDVDGRVAYFEDQIAIVGNYGPFSDSGDSGSLILDNPGSHPVSVLTVINGGAIGLLDGIQSLSEAMPRAARSSPASPPGGGGGGGGRPAACVSRLAVRMHRSSVNERRMVPRGRTTSVFLGW